MGLPCLRHSIFRGDLNADLKARSTVARILVAYFSLPYSALAWMRTGISGSASLHNVKKSS